VRGPRHKRYLMLTSEGVIGEDVKKELTRRIARISPAIAKKAVWFEHAVIVRTDNVDIPLVRAALEMSVDGVTLKSALTSGSIGKLKKAVPR
jgi:DNA-binding NarL/FixJ family response regulator